MTTLPQTEVMAAHGEQSKNQPPAVDLLGSDDTRGSDAGGARASGLGRCMCRQRADAGMNQSCLAKSTMQN